MIRLMKDKFGGRICSVKIKDVKISDRWWSCQQQGKKRRKVYDKTITYIRGLKKLPWKY